MGKGAQIAVVTGANRGIGLAIAAGLAASGVHVVATGRRLEAAASAIAPLQARGLPLEPFALDVTRAAERAELASHLRARHGGLDILVNNAGIALEGFDERVARETLETNFFAPLALTELLLPLVRAHGRVVLVSSGIAHRGGWAPALGARLSDPALDLGTLAALMRAFVDDVRGGRHRAVGWPTSAYGVSKAGLNALAAVLARDLQADARHILVNAMCPGWVRTGMGGASAPLSPEQGADTALWLAALPDDGPTGGFFRERAPAEW